MSINSFKVACVTTVLAMIVSTASIAQSSIEVQAMEQQVAELRRMGLSQAEIQPFEDMLAQLKQMEAEEGPISQSSVQLRDNYFDVSGYQSYGDCDQYNDMQLFSFCAAAAQHYQSYLQAAAHQASQADLDKIYEAHEASVKILVRMREF